MQEECELRRLWGLVKMPMDERLYIRNGKKEKRNAEKRKRCRTEPWRGLWNAGEAFHGCAQHKKSGKKMQKKILCFVQ